MSTDDINEIIQANLRRSRGEYTFLDKVDIAQDMYDAGLIDGSGMLDIIAAAAPKEDPT